MGELTTEAKERTSIRKRFRFLLASFFIGLGYQITPAEYYDSVQRDDLERIASGMGLQVVDNDG